MPPSNIRQLDEICRIYKNSLDEILGVESVALDVNIFKLPNNSGRYHRSIDKVSTKLKLIHTNIPGFVQDRTISKIMQIGNYDQVEINNGNYNEVTYLSKSADYNDIKISLSIYTKQVGDTI